MVDEQGKLIMETSVSNNKVALLDIDVTVAHPLRVKAIASAQIKTDTIDARTLAYLLHANLISGSLCAFKSYSKTERYTTPTLLVSQNPDRDQESNSPAVSAQSC
jgi:hypothetical protein